MISYEDLKQLKEKKAIIYIKSFLEKYKIKDVEKLENFSFWKILDDTDFNGTSNDITKFDGDSTKIVYAINYLLYNHLPEFSIPGFQLVKDINYRGETINTFNTLFSKDLKKRNQIKNLFGAEWAEVEKFKLLYQTIGNFMLLPAKTIQIKMTSSKTMSINSFKGLYSQNIYDYIDIFLDDLKQSLSISASNSENQDIKQLKLLIEKNNMYFNNKKFQDFIDDYYLLYFQDLKLNTPHYFHWYKNNSIFTDPLIFSHYKEFSLDYISKVSPCIKQRSQKLVEQLEPFLLRKD